jgi:hypothetical protein
LTVVLFGQIPFELQRKLYEEVLRLGQISAKGFELFILDIWIIFGTVLIASIIDIVFMQHIKAKIRLACVVFSTIYVLLVYILSMIWMPSMFALFILPIAQVIIINMIKIKS